MIVSIELIASTAQGERDRQAVDVPGGVLDGTVAGVVAAISDSTQLSVQLAN